MFIKKRRHSVIDSNCVKKQITRCAASQNVEIHLIEILLDDFRDDTSLQNRVSIYIFFKTNNDLERYSDNGFTFSLQTEIKLFLKKQTDKVDFVFDSHENVELKCNGNYLQYSIKRGSDK